MDKIKCEVVSVSTDNDSFVTLKVNLNSIDNTYSYYLITVTIPFESLFEPGEEAYISVESINNEPVATLEQGSFIANIMGITKAEIHTEVNIDDRAENDSRLAADGLRDLIILVNTLSHTGTQFIEYNKIIN